MISYLTYLLALVASPTVATTQTTPTEEPKTLEWKKETHDFGNIVEGTKAKYTFTFINKGNTPAAITSASASCGCTVPSYSKEPVAAGAEGSVTAIFDSNGKPGNNTKTITVVTNAGTYYLTIKCNVIKQVEKPKSPIKIEN